MKQSRKKRDSFDDSRKDLLQNLEENVQISECSSPKANKDIFMEANHQRNDSKMILISQSPVQKQTSKLQIEISTNKGTIDNHATTITKQSISQKKTHVNKVAPINSQATKKTKKACKLIQQQENICTKDYTLTGDDEEAEFGKLGADNQIIETQPLKTLQSTTSIEKQPQNINKIPKPQAIYSDQITELDIIEIRNHNQIKRKELGNLSLCDIKSISHKEIQFMVSKSKMIQNMKKYQKTKSTDIDTLQDDDEFDDPYDMEEFNAGAKDQDQNKNVFRRNYGVETQFPCLYILDAKLFPLDLDQVVRVVKFVAPDSNLIKFKHFKTDQQPQIDETIQLDCQGIEEINERFYSSEAKNRIDSQFYRNDSCVLQLIKSKKDSLCKVMEVPFDFDSKVKLLFSPCGKYLLLFAMQKCKILIYEINNGLEQTLMDIFEKKEPFRQYVSQELLKINNKCIFDKNSRYLALYSEFQVVVFNLSIDSPNFEKIYDIDKEKYEEIQVIQLVSENENAYRCDVACKLRNHPQLFIWNLCTLVDKLGLINMMVTKPKYKINPNKMIFYPLKEENLNAKMIVKISSNFKKVVLTIGKDCYELYETTDGQYCQRMIQWMIKKTVSGVIANENSFLFITHKLFDRTYEIRSSETEDLKIKIQEMISPGINQRILCSAQSTPDESGLGENLVILTCRDNNFYYHDINLKEKKNKNQLMWKFFISGAVMWPYVCMVDNFNQIWLFCAYDMNIMKQITLPYVPKESQVEQLFMTNEYDLFILVNHFRTQQYEILVIDLDEPRGFTKFNEQTFSLQSLFKYSASDVNNQPVLDLLARSSSAKATLSFNKKTFVFILHGNHLYYWVEGSTQLELIDNTLSSKIRQQDQDEFIYIKKHSDAKVQMKQKTIMKVTMRFSTYGVSELYQEQSQAGSSIKALVYDFQANKIIAMHKCNSESVKRKLMVYDLSDGRRIGTCWVSNSEFIGRMTADLFTLIDGHMYFDNQVFKLRYDSMLSSRLDSISEDLFINKYDNILDLQRGEQVLAKMPELSLNCHKQMYFLANQTFRNPYKLVVLPYLHERKLYINKMKPHCKYFYSAFEQFIHVGNTFKAINYMIAIEQEGNRIFVYAEGGLLVQRFDYDHLEGLYGRVIDVSPNGRNFIFQGNDEKIVHILVLKFDTCNHEFFWHFLKTIDLEQNINQFIENNVKVTFGSEDHDYAISVRDRILTDYSKFMLANNNKFKYTINDNQDLIAEITNYQDLELQNQFEQLIPDHERNIVHAILNYQQKIVQLRQEPVLKYNKSKLAWTKEKLEAAIETKLQILSPETQILLSEKQLGRFEQLNLIRCMENMQGSIIYFQKGELNSHERPSGQNNLENDLMDCESDESAYTPGIDRRNLVDLQDFRKLRKSEVQDHQENDRLLLQSVESQKIIFTKDYDEFDKNYKSGNITFSNSAIYFWGQFKSWMIKTKDMHLGMPIITGFLLKVDEESKDGLIKRVVVGPWNPNRETIFFQIRQSKHSDIIILWDVYNDCEVSFFETGPSSQIIFDGKGSGYIMDKDYIIVCDQGVKLKSYDFNMDLFTNYAFDISKGIHFDHRQHNFSLVAEYISLPFSFMTFVIKDKQHDMEQEEIHYQLDTEMFRFNINNKTFLTANNFISYDYERLEECLKYIKEKDPDLLELLHYYYTVDCDHQDCKCEEDLQDVEKGRKIKKIKKKVGPLHLAMANNRSLNIILQYMSYVKYNASETFKDILPECIENSKFIDYIACLPHKTVEMQNKSTLTIKSKFNDIIVSLESASMTFVDDQFYRDTFDENVKDPNNTNFPIKMSALKVDWIISEQGKEFLQALCKSENQQLFEQQAIIVVIEFLYAKYKVHVLKKSLPFYIVQLVVFYISLKINEESSEFALYLNIVLDVFNLMFCFYTLTQIIQNTKFTGWSIFSHIWVYFDFVYFCLLLLISTSSVLDKLTVEKHGKGFLNDNQIRELQSFLCLTVFGRLMYYMQIVDEIAPLINIIFKIFVDIKWFLIIYLIIIFGFSSSFELLGRNQWKTDLVDTNTGEIKNEFVIHKPDYLDSWNAFTHVYFISLGNFQTSMYALGNGTYKNLFMFYWFISGFLLQIHLLNMLIAIMGETFNQNNQIKHIQSLKSHLQFVLDNWWRDPIKNKHKIKYLIMAFTKEDETDEMEIINAVCENIDQLEQRVQDKFDDLNQKLSETVQNQQTLIKSIEKISDQMGISQELDGQKDQ